MVEGREDRRVDCGEIHVSSEEHGFHSKCEGKILKTEKGQFSFQSQRKAMPKKAQTTAQLHSSHTLAK